MYIELVGSQNSRLLEWSPFLLATPCDFFAGAHPQERNGQPHPHPDQSRPLSASDPNHPSQSSAQPRPQDPTTTTAHTCPICLEEVQEAWKQVETNCGHLFCAQCILIHWEHDARYPRACLCPNCRRQVSHGARLALVKF